MDKSIFSENLFNPFSNMPTKCNRGIANCTTEYA